MVLSLLQLGTVVRALEEVAQNRQILAYMYVEKYFLPAGDQYTELFTFLLQQLEDYTERLQVRLCVVVCVCVVPAIEQCRGNSLVKPSRLMCACAPACLPACTCASVSVCLSVCSCLHACMCLRLCLLVPVCVLPSLF